MSALDTDPQASGRRASEVRPQEGEIVVDDPFENLGWWPVEGFGRDRPELREPVVRLRYEVRLGVEYADDVDYQMTDAEGRVVSKKFTNGCIGVTLPLALEPKEQRRILRHGAVRDGNDARIWRVAELLKAAINVRGIRAYLVRRSSQFQRDDL